MLLPDDPSPSFKVVVPSLTILVAVSVRVSTAQPLKPLELQPRCVSECLEARQGCYDCVKTLAEQTYSTPRKLTLPFHKAHPSVPDPVAGLRHHHFLDRPPWVPGSVNESHTPGDGKVVAEGKVHANCPAMRARSGVTGVTIRMPYSVRFHRDGLIEVSCDWIPGGYLHGVKIEHPVDSPWIRLPQSHLQIFTVGDSRADVWIVNSGVYIEDAEYMASPGASPGNKGGSVGNKWMILPIPHKLRPETDRGWRVEQGILSSFQRVSRNANIPLQLNFTAIDPAESFIEIRKGTPMLQYVPAVLPELALEERPMPDPLADYLVLLSEIHGGGDMRQNGAQDKGAVDVMRSYQLKENPGFVQTHIEKLKKRERQAPKTEL